MSLVGPRIIKQDTTFREAISPTDKIVLALRFLPTGDSYGIPQYLFKISIQYISALIPDVYQAIIDSLKENLQVRRKFIYIIREIARAAATDPDAPSVPCLSVSICCKLC
nr:unnamed protein product [Callosobruchus analis]